MELPTLPLFLRPDKLAKLNDGLFRKTGCFAFLKTDRTICATRPRSWQDAFSIFVPGLYSVYHDYGCDFLQMLLDKRERSGFFPSNMDRCSECSECSECFKCWNHVNRVMTVLRPNLAHGILHPSQRTRLADELQNHYLRSLAGGAKRPDWPRADSWTELVDSLTEEHWMRVVRQLAGSADTLYHYLEKWGDAWAERPRELPDLKRRFADDPRFKKSFDSRVFRPIVEAALKDADRDVKQANIYLKVDWNDPDPDAPLVKWQQEIRDYFLQRAAGADEIYQELTDMVRRTIPPKQRTDSITLAKKYGFL